MGLSATSREHWSAMTPDVLAQTDASMAHPVQPRAVRPPHELAASRNLGDAVLRFLTTAAALSALAVLITIVVVLLTSAWSAVTHFGFSFLTVAASGVVPFTPSAAVVGTLYSSLLALLLAGPIGLLIAVFLSEMANRRVVLPLGFLVEFLAAIPSIVYGLWALFVLVPLIQRYVIPPASQRFGGFFLFAGASPTGLGLLSASIVLAVMIVPTIAALSRDVLTAVPATQREAMMALGATRWEVIWKVVVPYARSGIIGSVVLALGRAVGETMAVQMVIGNNILAVGRSILSPTTTIPAILVNQFNDSTALYRQTLFELALLLLLISVALNAVARILVWSVSRNLSDPTRV